jgi:hypothetical protein
MMCGVKPSVVILIVLAPYFIAVLKREASLVRIESTYQKSHKRKHITLILS